MAKKKNQNKKHRFKYTDPSSAGANLSTPSVSGGAAAVTAGAPVSGSGPVAGSGSVSRSARPGGVVARDFSYVGHDLRRVAIFAASLVTLELVLWFIYSPTGGGAAVYKLVKF